ncbi:MAG: sigma factor-like helix-turn-helix DNA-binding protein [Micavibrio sp.]|nr:sigma factor-like helix-turn-helix DNA-binding protein [Micavibrio sp.]
MRSCTPPLAENASDAPAALRRHEDFTRRHADSLWRFFNTATHDAAAAEGFAADCFQSLMPAGEEPVLVAALYDRAWQLADDRCGGMALVRALRQLPSSQRAVLLLQEYAGLEIADICAAVSLPREDVERLLADGRRKLLDIIP